MHRSGTAAGVKTTDLRKDEQADPQCSSLHGHATQKTHCLINLKKQEFCKAIQVCHHVILERCINILHNNITQTRNNMSHEKLS